MHTVTTGGARAILSTMDEEHRVLARMQLLQEGGRAELYRDSRRGRQASAIRPQMHLSERP